MSALQMCWMAGIGCLGTGLGFWLGTRRFRRRAAKAAMGVIGSLIMGAGGILILAINPWIADPQYRAYKRFYWDIDEGMTRAEVLEAMERRYPVAGGRVRPQVLTDDASSLAFFMGVEGSQGPNCEGVFLTMSYGRVVQKHYSPD